MEPGLNSEGSHIDNIDNLGGVMYYGSKEMWGELRIRPRGNLSSLTCYQGLRGGDWLWRNR
jgi:hypothetical protein